MPSRAASDRDSPQESLFGGIDTGPKRFAAAGASMTGRRWSGCATSSRPSASTSRPIRWMPTAPRCGGSMPSSSAICRPGCTGRPNTRAKIAGVIVSKQERTSARGNRFAFVQLSDASGIYEAMVFSELLAASRELLVPGTMVFLTADVRSEGDIFRLNAQTIRPLDEAVRRRRRGPAHLPARARGAGEHQEHHPARRPRQGQGQSGAGTRPRPRGGDHLAGHLDDLRRHPPGDQVDPASGGCAGYVGRYRLRLDHLHFFPRESGDPGLQSARLRLGPRFRGGRNLRNQYFHLSRTCSSAGPA